MKKIVYITFSVFLIIWLNNCAGYKPIFSYENINFEISDYSIKGDETLGKRIYYKLDNLSKSVKDKENKRSISLTINVKKDKIATVKDSAGKVSEYKITLNTEVKIIDFFNNNKLLEDTLIASTSYKVQSQYSDTLNLENKSIDDLINNTYRDLLIKLTQTLSDK